MIADAWQIAHHIAAYLRKGEEQRAAQIEALRRVEARLDRQIALLNEIAENTGPKGKAK